VNTPAAAKAVVKIKNQLKKDGYGHVPLVGDFHFNGHLLLQRFPDCAAALDKYRINPGNVGQEKQFSEIIRIALKNKKPVRIGVNWGSLDQVLLTKLMEKNGKKKNPLSDREVIIEAMVESALSSAKTAEKLGLAANQIVLSVKMSELQDMVKAYQLLQQRCKKMKKMYPLHLGLTEAGSDMQGLISSSAALGILLQQGIGDTIRISLTPSPKGSRTDEVEACKILLQSLGLRSFQPTVTSCPGCGRTSNDLYQRLAKEVNEYIQDRMPIWKKQYLGVEKLKVAVMGCVVNGPGEAKHADIAISLPGNAEKPSAMVYQKGKHVKSLKGDHIISGFKTVLDTYLAENHSQKNT
jgi:(E)-4-hydroxy-3-methylbut-2-enyl-diphosphate synthase